MGKGYAEGFYYLIWIQPQDGEEFGLYTNIVAARPED